MKKLKKEVKGITLIALIVTIIVLLILAAIAINLTVGNNGLFQRAQNGAEQSEIATEKEQIELAKTDGRAASMLEKGAYRLETKYLDEGLKSYIGEGKYELEEVDDGWIVTIVKSGRKYEINEELEGKYPIEGVEPTDPQIFTYEVNEDNPKTITITGFKQEYEKIYYSGYDEKTGTYGNMIELLVFPYEIDGYTVTKIKHSYIDGAGYSRVNNGARYVKKIIFPNSVTEINCIIDAMIQGWGTDAYIKDLYKSFTEEIYLPYNLKVVNLSGLHSLKRVNIPESVEDLNFNYCISLNSLNIPRSLKEIKSSTFKYCFSLVDVQIPNTVNVIGEDAFCYCKNMKNITLSSSLRKIEKSAFYECQELKSIEIPSSVTSIGENAFGKCEKLEQILIKKGSTLSASSPNYPWGADESKIVFEQ